MTIGLSPEHFEASDGSVLVTAARQAIEKYLETKRVMIDERLVSTPKFEQKLGCFVTLKNSDEERSLRGCIGFVEPIYKLSEALSRAAVYAATEDPRFPPVALSDLKELLVEISVLTKPVEIKVKDPAELPKKIDVGVNGLVMKWTFGSGLLLPQVATEFGWDSTQFLENLSLKAGAPSGQWRAPGTVVYKFQAIIFQEISPLGDVVLTRNQKDTA